MILFPHMDIEKKAVVCYLNLDVVKIKLLWLLDWTMKVAHVTKRIMDVVLTSSLLLEVKITWDVAVVIHLLDVVQIK